MASTRTRLRRRNREGGAGGGAGAPTLGEVQTEVADAATFYRAEDYPQYLQKGGQSAKKSAEETIRCYG